MAFEPPNRSKKRRWILGIVFAAILLLGGGCVAFERWVSSGRIETGDCVRFARPNETDIDQSSRPINTPCDAQEATFEVVVQKDGVLKCLKEHATYQRISQKKGSPSQVEETWCMIPIMTQGQCYVLDAQDLATVVDRSCGRKGSYRVLKRIDGNADDGLCGSLSPDAETVTYAKPERMYCVIPVFK